MTEVHYTVVATPERLWLAVAVWFVAFIALAAGTSYLAWLLIKDRQKNSNDPRP